MGTANRQANREPKGEILVITNIEGWEPQQRKCRHSLEQQFSAGDNLPHPQRKFCNWGMLLESAGSGSDAAKLYPTTEMSIVPKLKKALVQWTDSQTFGLRIPSYS